MTSLTSPYPVYSRRSSACVIMKRRRVCAFRLLSPLIVFIRVLQRLKPFQYDGPTLLLHRLRSKNRTWSILPAVFRSPELLLNSFKREPKTHLFQHQTAWSCLTAISCAIIRHHCNCWPTTNTERYLLTRTMTEKSRAYFLLSSVNSSLIVQLRQI